MTFYSGQPRASVSARSFASLTTKSTLQASGRIFGGSRIQQFAYVSAGANLWGAIICITRERRFALTNSATILFLPDLGMVFFLPFGNTKPRFRAARRGTSESSIELDLIDGFDRSGSSQRGRTLRRKELLLRLLNRCST